MTSIKINPPLPCRNIVGEDDEQVRYCLKPAAVALVLDGPRDFTRWIQIMPVCEACAKAWSGLYDDRENKN